MKPYIAALLTEEIAIDYIDDGVKGIMKFLLDCNRVRKESFINAISSQKENLKDITSLEDDVLHDIRFSMHLTYREISEIFGISVNKIARIYQKRRLIDNVPYKRVEMFKKFGVRLINVDKFVSYLTKES